MRIRCVCIAALFAACAAIPAVSQNRSYFVAFASSSTPAAAANGAELQIYDLVNRQRSKSGLTFLSWDESLASIAREYSRRMAAGEFFGHVDPTGFTVKDRIETAGINWRSVGENLFNGRNIDDYPHLAVKMWMNSDAHRANILDDRWSYAGVGIAKAADGRVYVTQLYMQK